MSSEARVLPPLRLILVGMSGVGKSAAGNTILGREKFISEASPSSLTLTSKKGEGEVCERRVLVVDTPGFCNTEISEKKLREEMQTAQDLCHPGPHAFLLVIQLGRFTQQESRVMETLQELRVNQHTMVLFSYGDRLRKKTIQEFISSDANLQQLLEKCGNRYHVFNNKQMEDRSQVSRLLQKIDNMVATEKKTLDEGDGGMLAMRTRSMEVCGLGHSQRFSRYCPSEAPVHPTTLHAPVRTNQHANMSRGNEQLEELRIVLVGKTGVGKTAAGNTILGTEELESDISFSSIMKKCRKARREVDGRDVSVIDTPGLFDDKLTNDIIIDEIKKCISLSSPGPHVFLVVIQIGRFTAEEQETVEIIQETFGAEAAKYTMALFTRGDKLKTTVEEFLSKNQKLAEFTDKCRGRYHVFNNEDTNRSQVLELLKKIDRMVTMNGGGCYTNEMYTMAEKMKRQSGEEAEKYNNAMKRQVEPYVRFGCTIL